jgi:hypothetical protein
MEQKDADRFWSKVDIAGACWIWRGYSTKGYGLFSLKGKPRLAHRVSYEMAYGAIPDGMDILHRCDMPSCVRPDHLWTGTHMDNMRDMEAKGRGNHAYGERINTAKLTWTEVREIRRRYQTEVVTQRRLALEYDVHFSLISLILKGKIWKER